MTKSKTLPAPEALDILFPFMRKQTGHSYEGFHRTTPFKALIGTMLSLRARGVVVHRVAEELFEKATTPQEILNIPSETLSGLLRPLGHHERRVKFIRETCQILVKDYGGNVPQTEEELMALPGVGRKTTNLTLDAGFGQKTVTVDTHVHRIMNIWGYVDTKDADHTEVVLREKLPEKYWAGFNPLLVDFGNLVCWPASPKCQICPLDEICPKLGLKAYQKRTQYQSPTGKE